MVAQHYIFPPPVELSVAKWLTSWPVSCKCEGVYSSEGFTLKGEQRALHHLCPHSAGQSSGMEGPGGATLEHEVETVS